MDRKGGEPVDYTFTDRYHTQAARTATHIYLLPHPALRPYIAHYTLCLPSPVPPPAGPALTLIPDASGCFVLTLLPQGLEGRMYGPTTQVVTVENDLGSGPPRFFVEFKPGGLYAFTGIPQWELADRVWAMEAAVPALYGRAVEAAQRAADLDELVRDMDRALLAWERQDSPAGPMLGFLAAHFAARSSLADYTGYSPRHLSRLFREGAGMGQKSFARVLRVNQAAGRLKAGHLSLTRLAQELGYYDQAHFIHEFKATCGVTPGVFAGGLSDFYNEPMKF